MTPSASIEPQSVSGAGTPRPMKPSAASSRIASATWNVALTMIVPIVFGMMWRSTIRAVAAAHHAHGQHVLAHAQRQRLAAHEPGRHEPGREADHEDQDRRATGGRSPRARSRRKRIGTESSTSTMRIISASTQPPKKPEIAPYEHADDRGDRRCGEADLERDLAAVHDPAEDVEAALVGAEQVAPSSAARSASSRAARSGCWSGSCGRRSGRRSRRAPTTTMITSADDGEPVLGEDVDELRAEPPPIDAALAAGRRGRRRASTATGRPRCCAGR